MIHLVQARRAVKVELPQFVDNTVLEACYFFMAILPVLQLPSYEGTVLSIPKCKSCDYQSARDEKFK